jgi:acyl-CoA thioesterase I
MPGVASRSGASSRWTGDLLVRNDGRANFLGVEPAVARANHARVNAILAEAGQRYGALVDLHAHFLRGDPSWLVHTVEPSLIGASEVRRAFRPFAIP